MSFLPTPSIRGVRVPELPLPPAAYEHHPLTLALLAVTALGTVWFTVIFCKIIICPARGAALWRRLLVAGAVTLVACLACWPLITIGEEQARAARIEHENLEETARSDVIGEIEQVYGVTFTGFPLVPLHNGETRHTDLILPDGRTEECEIMANGTHYSIVCGASGETEGFPLERLSTDG